MSNSPKVETLEISDAELDNISGGLVSAGVTTPAGAVGADVDVQLPNVPGVPSVAGLANTVTGLAGGLPTGAVTGLVSGL
ncbi:type A2 lantipeptide [Streptomyces beihaiensis]|uniref:Type A2 lantipeptide n=1 Tax=Streptomyces beihaiensis TaxID=2984495 RepID=A0ABT3TTD4_9ACTN|nr:type A2 lantipeptide [Streptomyces beihaiensis]MCX3060289.1 type A2 lantipeptide [Streptomyces beihaiensis]